MDADDESGSPDRSCGSPPRLARRAARRLGFIGLCGVLQRDAGRWAIRGGCRCWPACWSSATFALACLGDGAGGARRVAGVRWASAPRPWSSRTTTREVARTSPPAPQTGITLTYVDGRGARARDVVGVVAPGSDARGRAAGRRRGEHAGRTGCAAELGNAVRAAECWRCRPVAGPSRSRLPTWSPCDPPRRADYSPTLPSTDSRIRSACPLCRAYSSIRCSTIHRSAGSPAPQPLDRQLVQGRTPSTSPGCGPGLLVRRRAARRGRRRDGRATPSRGRRPSRRRAHGSRLVAAEGREPVVLDLGQVLEHPAERHRRGGCVARARRVEPVVFCSRVARW